MQWHGLRIGAVSHKLAPLYAYWSPHLKGWLGLAGAVLAGYAVTLRRTRVFETASDWRAGGWFAGALIVVAATVAMIDGGPRAIATPYLRADLEYYGAIHLVGDPAEFLRGYAAQIDRMPMHARVHPPGAILFLWLASRLLGDSPAAVAWATIAVGSLLAPLTFWFARCVAGPSAARFATQSGPPGSGGQRQVAGSSPARFATALLVVTPSVVLFTSTSMDVVFAVPLVAAMGLFWSGLVAGGWTRSLAAGAMLGVASFMTYSAAIAGLWCTLAALLTVWSDRTRLGLVARALAAAAAGFVVFQVAVWTATGFDPVQTFRAALAGHHEIMAGTRHETWARHGHIALANLVAFLICVGLPTVAVWRHAVVQAVRGIRTSRAACPFTLATVATLLVTAAAPVFTLEVERIWLFLVPLVVIDAGRVFAESPDPSGPLSAFRATAWGVAIQTLLTETLLCTYW